MKEEILDNNDITTKDIVIEVNLYSFIKRFLDIFFSLIALIPFLILIVIIKIIHILNKDFNSIFFTQNRVGKDNKMFKMYKFRTMVPDAEEVLKEMLKDKKYKKEWNKNHKFENDPRITKIGNILRKTSLDEIPQIINIIKGDMSIIGPRPVTQEEVDAYKKNKKKIVSVRPGLTGWWACNGRSNISASERKKLELYYVDNLSFKLDLKIFFLTIIKVLKRDGAK